MTTNQVNYWKLQEEKRHNVKQESMDEPLKASQTEYYVELAPKTKAETGYTRISSIVKGIEGFERASHGLESLSKVASNIVGAVASAL